MATALTNGFIAGKSVGPAKMLQVKSGDVVALEVYSRYLTGTGGSTAVVAGLASAVSAALGLQPGDAAISALNTNIPGLSGLITPAGGVPKAYLFYILYNSTFTNYQFGYQLVSVASLTAFEKLSLAVTVGAGFDNGYLYTYVANESSVSNSVSVYFDDFYIRHTQAAQGLQVMQTEEYYPFGLTFNSYSRVNSVTNDWKFQGQEHIDDLGLNWDSFKWRNHQPDIGRFFNVDPLAEDYYYNSPYAFSENKVTTHIELEGLEAIRAPRPQYQTMLNYRSMVRREMVRTSYEYSNREIEEVFREPISMKPGKAGESVGLMLELADSWGLEGKLQSLQLSVTQQEVVNTDGFGNTKTEKTEFVFSGPDAGKLEGMERDYQNESNKAFDKKFEAFASGKLGKDFKSLSPEEQAKFKVENLNAAGAIRMSVNSAMGPSPKQQILQQIQNMLKQGTATETAKRKDLPVIRQGN